MLIVAVASVNVSVSNVVPRRTIAGAILPAHDGGVYQYGARGRTSWYFYGMSYGTCRESDGCSNSTTGACGFRDDHNVSIFTSPDLSQESWAYAGNALPLGRPRAIYYRPKVIYNARTQRYVLWVNWRESLSGSHLHYLTATARSPGGPFALATTNVTTRFADGGDFTVFADDDGQGYLLYQSRASGHVASVERLTDDFTDSAGGADPAHSSGLFGPKGIEAPTLFKRKGVYYATVGKDCCFCTAGSGVIFFTAAAPLGPWVQHGQVGRDARGASVTKAQQNFVVPVPGPGGEATFLWTGDRWGSAPDGVKDHDFQTWLPLEFEPQPGNASAPDLIKQMVWRDSFTLDV